MRRIEAFGSRLRRLAPCALTPPSLFLHPPLQQFGRILHCKHRPEGESKLTKRCYSCAKALGAGKSLWGPDAAQSRHALRLYSDQSFSAMLLRAFSTKPIGAEDHKNGGSKRLKGVSAIGAEDHKNGGSKRLKGVSARWNSERGFGFIIPTNGGEDIFCHFSSITDGNVLCDGDIVEYQAEYDDHKGKYRDIEVTGGWMEDDRTDCPARVRASSFLDSLGLTPIT